MVYGIVKQHDGYITCYSELGVGTTFKIYLPVIETEEERQEETDKAVFGSGSETILLVDDEEFVRTLGQRMLTGRGYTVLTAGNGIDALEVYKQQRGKISLVILDLVMPEMGGKQCLEELLIIDPKVKVLIASGQALNARLQGTIESGARAFVSKPFKMTELLKKVRDVLDAD
jgi:CheY-like chemotaxis protein